MKLAMDELMDIAEALQDHTDILIGLGNEFQHGFRIVRGDIRMSQSGTQYMGVRRHGQRPFLRYAQAFLFDSDPALF